MTPNDYIDKLALFGYCVLKHLKDFCFESVNLSERFNLQPKDYEFLKKHVAVVDSIYQTIQLELLQQIDEVQNEQRENS